MYGRAAGPSAEPVRTRHGVNLATFDSELIVSVHMRKFDGANSWRFFDELLAAEQAPTSEA